MSLNMRVKKFGREEKRQANSKGYLPKLKILYQENIDIYDKL